MSLYRHVGSKDVVVQARIDAALGSEPLPAKRPASWREPLEVAVRAEWRALRRHPWLARVMRARRR